MQHTHNFNSLYNLASSHTFGKSFIRILNDILLTKYIRRKTAENIKVEKSRRY